MTEEQAIARFLDATLTGNSDLAALIGDRVYEGLAPGKRSFPYVLFSLHSGRDTNAMGQDRRTLVRPLYLVKAVTQASDYAQADAVAGALDAALMGAGGPVTVGEESFQVLTVSRETPVRYLETRDGVTYQHVGGLYRFPCYRLS